MDNLYQQQSLSWMSNHQTLLRQHIKKCSARQTLANFPSSNRKRSSRQFSGCRSPSRWIRKNWCCKSALNRASIAVHRSEAASRISWCHIGCQQRLQTSGTTAGSVVLCHRRWQRQGKASKMLAWIIVTISTTRQHKWRSRRRLVCEIFSSSKSLSRRREIVNWGRDQSSEKLRIFSGRRLTRRWQRR